MHITDEDKNEVLNKIRDRSIEYVRRDLFKSNGRPPANKDEFIIRHLIENGSITKTDDEVAQHVSDSEGMVWFVKPQINHQV